MAEQTRRELVAIGCSAGGIPALPTVLAGLTEALPAAVLVIQHLTEGSELAEILQLRSPLPVSWAEQGTRLEHGHVYVAPAGAHVLVIDHHLRLDAGARENHFRPSIDRAFRSVAALYGARAVGVILTGMLDDGVIGLSAIRACGGYAIVQDPATAEFPEMPTHAIAQAGADAVLALEAIAPKLVALVAEPIEMRAPAETIALEAELDRGPSDPAKLDRLGVRAPMPCPECNGPLWRAGDARTRHYRCYLGHSANPRSMLRHSREELERSLWTAVRALHDRAAVFETLARDAEHAGNRIAAVTYADRAREAMASSATAQKFLLELQGR